MNDEKEKIFDDLEDRIKRARSDVDENFDDSEEDADTSFGEGANAGYTFLALVISGWLIGFGFDRLFSTLPWGMIFMTLMGFVAGVYRANEAMKKNK